MDKERLPRWGWLLVGLIAASLLATLLNVVALYPIGMPETYSVVTTVALMAPVMIYVGLWYDEERQAYWDRSDLRVVGDVSFVVIAAALGSATILVMLADVGLARIIRDVVGMVGGFAAGWGLFWWRNTELYRDDDRR